MLCELYVSVGVFSESEDVSWQQINVHLLIPKNITLNSGIVVICM